MMIPILILLTSGISIPFLQKKPEPIDLIDRPAAQSIQSEDTLPDWAARHALRSIVKNRRADIEAKETLLELLYWRVVNAHPHGAAAEILEDIANERIALRAPGWAGRRGNWKSISQG